MTHHEQLLERIGRANPVPDPHDPPLGAITSDAALSTIMTSLDATPLTHQPPSRPSKAAVAWAGGFLVALVAIALSALVFSRSTEPATETTVPSTTTTVVTTTSSTLTDTTTPTTTTTAPRTEAFPGLPKLRFGPLEPGDVAVEDAVSIPFAITVPDITTDFPRGLWVEQPGNPGVGIVPRDAIESSGIIDYPDPVLIFAMSRSSDPFDDVVTDISNELPIASRSDLTIGDSRAAQLDTDVVDGGFPLYSFGTQTNGEPIFGTNENQQHRVYIIEAPSGTMVVWLEIAPQAWGTLAPYWEQIVSSIRFP